MFITAKAKWRGPILAQKSHGVRHMWAFSCLVVLVTGPLEEILPINIGFLRPRWLDSTESHRCNYTVGFSFPSYAHCELGRRWGVDGW